MCLPYEGCPEIMAYMCGYVLQSKAERTDTLTCVCQLMDANNDKGWVFCEEKNNSGDKDPCSTIICQSFSNPYCKEHLCIIYLLKNTGVINNHFMSLQIKIFICLEGVITYRQEYLYGKLPIANAPHWYASIYEYYLTNSNHYLYFCKTLGYFYISACMQVFKNLWFREVALILQQLNGLCHLTGFCWIQRITVPSPSDQTNNLSSSNTEGRKVICVYRSICHSLLEPYSN